MNQASPILLVVMTLSSVLQFVAAGAAIRMIRPSGIFIAWLLLAGGFVLQGIRRLISLIHVLSGGFSGDITVEILGLLISLLMLAGILKFQPLFDEIACSHRALLKKQDELAKSNLELEAFVSTVSHDLRTPLTAVIGFAEFLSQESGKNLDKQSLECLKEIETQGIRMLALLEDLLTLARVGHVDYPIEPVDADDVVREVLVELEETLVDTGVVVTKGDFPRVYVPETLLAEIFRNLIENALRYACPSGGTIEIAGARDGQVVRFYVRDHGPGIPETDRERVFEMFYRGAVGKATKGTGIGLAIVRKIAQHYGGRAWVEETPQGGSTFWFELEDRGEPEIIQ